ncbi:MAG: AraC family transcriptional regulator [Lachnospiraceae bacterium]|nr:AraC family transcriptional regulator [Lachnospiraceae bacterium]
MKIENYREFFSRREQVRLQILDGGHAVCEGGEWAADVASPGCSRLYYILGGDPFLVVDGEELPLLPGHCYLIPTGLPFRYDCRTGMEQIYFHLNLRNESGWDLFRGCGRVLGMAYPEELAGRIETACGEKICGITGALLGEALVKETLARIFMENDWEPEDKTLSPCVQAAVSEIWSHPSIQMTLETLAVRSFVSPSTLAKKFRKEMGMTLGTCIDEAVFQEAEQLLRRSALSIREISERLGFGDQFYFSRRFREKYKTTPRSYRKQTFI